MDPAVVLRWHGPHTLAGTLFDAFATDDDAGRGRTGTPPGDDAGGTPGEGSAGEGTPGQGTPGEGSGD